MPSAQCLEWNTVGSQGMLLLPSPEFQETKRMAGNPSQAEKESEGEMEEVVKRESRRQPVGST